MIEILSSGLLLLGLAFFAAGTAGLLRFPDVHTRLHALTKADNVGLGLLILGLALRAPSLGAVLELGLAWILVLAGSATASHLVARRALGQEGER